MALISLFLKAADAHPTGQEETLSIDEQNIQLEKALDVARRKNEDLEAELSKLLGAIRHLLVDLRLRAIVNPRVPC